jgi:hypothetical protein
MSTTINEAKNYPTEKIRERSKKIKDDLKSIESAQLERDSSKKGMSSGLSREVATKVTGPIMSLRKKLKETVDDKKPTDDISSNLRSKKALEQIEKELKTIQDNAKRLTVKVSKELNSLEPKKLKAERAARNRDSASEQKKQQLRKDIMAGKFAESIDFKKRTRQYLGLNEMAVASIPEKGSLTSRVKGYIEKELEKYTELDPAKALTRISQGLGRTASSKKAEEKLGDISPADFKEGVREEIKKRKEKIEKEEKKEDKKVEESTRYRRSYYR